MCSSSPSQALQGAVLPRKAVGCTIKDSLGVLCNLHCRCLGRCAKQYCCPLTKIDKYTGRLDHCVQVSPRARLRAKLCTVALGITSARSRRRRFLQGCSPSKPGQVKVWLLMPAFHCQSKEYMGGRCALYVTPSFSFGTFLCILKTPDARFWSQG